MRVHRFGAQPNPIRGALRRLVGRLGRQRRSDWQPSLEVRADWEMLRAIPESPLLQVVGVGRTVVAADLTVELLAIEVREHGAVIYWRARSAREGILLSADVAVADDRETPYHVVPGGGSGSAQAWEGQTHFRPVPPVGARLTINMTSFGPSDHLPTQMYVPTERIVGPWLFEVEIPSGEIRER
jgi:hypothetical protein